MIVLRLLLRCLVVPFGAFVALWAAAATAVIFHWNDFIHAVEAEGGTAEGMLALAFMFGPLFVAQVMVSAFAILTPGAVAILLAEAFAIRTWMFHIPAGGLSAWVGSTMRVGFEQPHPFFEDPLLVVGAGLIAGAVYWAIAGWNAGFWKPVFPPLLASSAPNSAPDSAPRTSSSQEPAQPPQSDGATIRE